MEGLGDYIHCNFRSSTLERPAAAFKENKLSSHWTESCKSYPVLSTASRQTPPPFDCGFGRSCFGCTLPDSHAFQQGALTSSPSVYGDSVKQNRSFSGLIGHNLHCSAITSRINDLRVYEGYKDSYSRTPRYIDLPVVGRDPMHDMLPMEDLLPRDRPVCGSSVYRYRDQPQSPQLWEPSIPEEAVLKQQESRTSYRRGRKKRVPYTKLQLRELEREFTMSKFITKDKRRLIASSTSLSERQVTIWFQNRRVKDKKVIFPIKGDETCC